MSKILFAANGNAFIITPHYPFQLAITCGYKAEKQERVWAVLSKLRFQPCPVAGCNMRKFLLHIPKEIHSSVISPLL